jgi:uncharacterized membrane protein (DUF2068 family)
MTSDGRERLADLAVESAAMTDPNAPLSPTPTSVAATAATASIARGVRLIAAFEALKGVLVLGAGFGLLSLLHRDLQATAERLVRHSHLNPAHHYPRIFIEAASRTNDSRLLSLAGLALLYSVMRFVEAYGLWRTRLWAEWFAIIAGSIFLPVEIYEILRRATWMRGMVLLVNLSIVAYLVFVLLASRRAHAFRAPRGRIRC